MNVESKSLKQYPGNLFIISASSGVGKTTLVETICASSDNAMRLKQVITYTTRSARVDELAGEHYHFISEQDFKQKIVDNFFLEWSMAYGHYYGSPQSILEDLKQGISKVIVVDRQGALSLKKLVQQSVLIWLYVQDLSCLKERLLQRKSESLADIQKRVVLAHQEQEAELNQPCFDYHICNDHLEHALAEFQSIMIKYI